MSNTKAKPVASANREQPAALQELAQLAMLYLENDPQVTAHGLEIATRFRVALGLQERVTEQGRLSHETL